MTFGPSEYATEYKGRLRMGNMGNGVTTDVTEMVTP
jgi:hypothetical protein